jgi:hypothetical protein
MDSSMATDTPQFRIAVPDRVLRSHTTSVVSRIASAVQAELSAASRGIRFDVLGFAEEEGILTFVVESDTALLDVSMEDGSIRWEGEYAGTAEIVSVDPDTSQIHAVLQSGELPKCVLYIWVNPPRFLEPLAKCWQSSSPVTAAMAAYDQLRQSVFHPNLITNASRFPELRDKQRTAFSLTGHDVSFLWGPPGTGKTHTLGRLIAAYIVQHSARVLLVSSTNVAVDQAVISIRDGLSSLGASLRAYPVYRFGSRFIPSYFEGDAEALIPVRSKSLIGEYRRVLNSRPSPKQPSKYKLWKESLEALREQIRQENLGFMSAARVAAVTATYAVTKYSDLKESGAFDLIVFDEASQVGKAHALMVAGLGSRMMFAGDPKQLSPIVQSNDEQAETWLGKSPFDWKDLSAPGSVILDEQSRMVDGICRVVSETFYDGQLRVASDVDQDWYAVRKLNLHQSFGAEHVSPVAIRVEAEAMGRERRWRSPQSAEVVVQVVAALRTSVDLSRVIVLTPYRAQRAEICQQLKAAGLDEKIVSTVHRAQGSERLVVIFDPVRPSSEFLNGPEGERLINVAISRAQARLFLLVHPDYNRHDTVLARILANRVLLDSERLPQIVMPVIAPRLVSDPLKRIASRAVVPNAPTQLELKQQRRNGPDPIAVFKQELRKYLASGSRTDWDLKAFASDVRFGKISYAERERIIKPFLSKTR